VADRLRRGDAAAHILDDECARPARQEREPQWADKQHLRQLAACALASGVQADLDVVTAREPAYPPALLAIADPPAAIWVSGQRNCLQPPGVAIVGSRAGTSYALDVAEQLAADLAARGVTIVSGLARGVDSAAHRGALSAGGTTIAVVGCGADVVYPAEHAALTRDIIRTGAVVSELLPGTEPRPHFFPRRNRIISGLVRAVVVVEAGEQSGSLITARCALDQGRDVMAVPGNVLSGRNRGGHALLKDGARLVESADDVLEELGIATGSGVSPVHGTATDDPLLAALTPGEPVDLEEIAARSAWPIGRILPHLLELELLGRVRREPGGRFMRTDRTC
jgi:DNA processing protein